MFNMSSYKNKVEIIQLKFFFPLFSCISFCLISCVQCRQAIRFDKVHINTRLFLVGYLFIYLELSQPNFAITKSESMFTLFVLFIKSLHVQFQGAQMQNTNSILLFLFVETFR